MSVVPQPQAKFKSANTLDTFATNKPEYSLSKKRRIQRRDLAAQWRGAQICSYE